jgi:hypothetical protein
MKGELKNGMRLQSEQISNYGKLAAGVLSLVLAITTVPS